MPKSDQGITKERYMVIPRVAIFLRSGDAYLLLRGAPTKRLWAGKYNGLGGHLERGEDVLSAAKRELREESGLEADLWLCGTVIVDAGAIGVCMFVFSGEGHGEEPVASREGTPEWIEYQVAGTLPTVEDVPILLERIHHMKRGDAPFSARSFYDENDQLRMVFEG